MWAVPDLSVSLVDWKRLKPLKFNISALHVCEISNITTEAYDFKEDIEGIIFAGSYYGEIARFFILHDREMPISCSFGHRTKIVQFANCKIPIIKCGVASLSFDGTICVWSVVDGICIRKFDRILPNGCQRMTISELCVDFAIVSGAFAPIFIVNLSDGSITQMIHPSSSFVVCISFYVTQCTEWLFTFDSNGCATYSTKFPNFTNTQKIRLITPPENNDFISATPSPDFSYLLAICPQSFYLIDLKYQHFPSYHSDTDSPIIQCIWINTTKFALIEMNGHLSVYNVHKSQSTYTHIDIVSSLIRNPDQLRSKTECMDQTYSNMVNEIDDLLNPFSNPQDPNIDLIKENIIPDSLSTKINQIQTSKATVMKPDNIINVTSSPLDQPIITGFKDNIVLGFDDIICISSHNFKECSIHQNAFIKNNNPITAQCFIMKNDNIIALAEGSENGEIHIRRIHPSKNFYITTKHNGRVVSMCSTKNYLITSGDDCLVFIFDLESFELKASFCQFTMPVVSILRVKYQTNTEIDNCVIFRTRNNVLSLINLNELQSKRIMTGHDGRIKSIWYHPPTKILLVEANSLYFWSLLSGNLESIVTGNKKFIIMHHLNEQYIPFTFISNECYGINIQPLKIGSLSLQIPIIHINKYSKVIQNIFKENSNEEINNIIRKIPNFSLLFGVLSENTRHFFKTKFKYHSKLQFQFGFVGHHYVQTIHFPNIKFNRRSHWQISPLASSIIFACRIIISTAMKENKIISNYIEEMFHLDISAIQKISHFQRPSIFHLMTFLFSCDIYRHDLLLRLVSSYDSKLRLVWIDKLRDAAKCFPNYRNVFTFLRCFIADTILDKLNDEYIQSNVIQLISGVQSNEFGPFVRELLARGIDRYGKYLTNDFFKKLFFSIINNLNNNHLDDYSFKVLFKKVTSSCIIFIKNLIKDQNKELIYVLFKKLINLFNSKILLLFKNVTEIEQFLFMLMDGFLLLNEDDSLKLISELNNKCKIISFNLKFKYISYIYKNSTLKLIVYQYKNGISLKGEDKIDCNNISSIDFDLSGKFALLKCFDDKILFLIRINILMTDDGDVITFKQSYSTEMVENTQYFWGDEGGKLVTKNKSGESTIQMKVD